MAENLDYYAILQVSRNATTEEIEAAHERLSRLYDPETSHKSRAAERHAEVQAAFAALSDQTKRREVDKDLRAGEVAVAGAGRPSDFLANRYLLAAAGVIVASLAVLLLVIVVFGGIGGDDDALVTDPNTPAPTPAPTVPAQTPGVPDDNPPEITGEEVVLASGLTYIDFDPGAGEVAAIGYLVAVNYTGWLQETGVMFDSSISRDSTFPVTIGAGGVIPGWELGLPGLAEGGTRRLIIPPELAYREAGSGDTIPPNATLIFDIILVDILTTAP